MSRGGQIAAVYALLALVAVPIYAHFTSPNELSRWALAAAVVEDHGLEVSRYAALLGPGFEDLAVANGRTYSNKAPGGTLVALPGYLLARPLAGPPGPEAIRPALQGMRLFGATLPLVVLALLVDRAARRLGASDEGRRRAVFALLFATPLFAYGLLLFAHALVACALFGAFSALFLSWPGQEKRDDIFAGAWIGLAVAADTTAALPGLVLVVAASRRDLARLARIAAGGLPFALLVGAYNGLCFGSPFTPSYAFEKNAAYGQVASRGVFGVTLPSLLGLLRLLFDPAKGLLLFVPALVLVPRALGSLRRSLGPDAFAASVLVPVSILLLFSGYPNFGGWTVGPRYVVGALPFLVLPLAFARSGALAAALVGASAAAVVGTTIPFPFVPDGFAAPWGSFALPLLQGGVGLPLAFGGAPGPAGIAVPVALVAAASVLAFPLRRLAPLAAGAVLWWGIGLLPGAFGRPDPVHELQVAYVRDVYLDRGGELERLIRALPAGTEVPQRLFLRRDRERALPPPAWR